MILVRIVARSLFLKGGIERSHVTADFEAMQCSGSNIMRMITTFHRGNIIGPVSLGQSNKLGRRVRPQTSESGAVWVNAFETILNPTPAAHGLL